MYAEHVTADAGTGLVHTAPGHGYEDFVVGKQYGLKPFTPVNGGGMFTVDGGEWEGQNVFKANKPIVEKLRTVGALLHAKDFSHSYPHCWRCHNPLIFLATEQWFMSIDHHGLRGKVVDEIDSAKWYPAWSRDRIRNMTETRPGLVHLAPARVGRADSGAQVRRLRRGRAVDRERWIAVEEIFAREGSDAWYSRPAADFVAPGVKCAKCGGASLRQGGGHPRRVVRFGLVAGRGARRAPRAEVAGRRVSRSGRAGARMVQLVARLRGRPIAARRRSKASSATG